jgi:hypothetical protein
VKSSPISFTISLRKSIITFPYSNNLFYETTI